MIKLIRNRIVAAVLLVSLGVSTSTLEIEASNEDIRYNTQADIEPQVHGLIKTISNELDMDEELVKTVYSLASNDTLNIKYMDNFPSIYTDKMKSDSLKFKGVNTKYQYLTSVKCKDVSILRPSEAYMPDVLYSLCYDLHALMQIRMYCSRGSMQAYFDSLRNDIKQLLVLSESLIIYLGDDDINGNKVIRAYELYANNHFDNISDALMECGIQNKYSISVVQKLFDDNSDILNVEVFEDAKEVYEMPYTLGYSSRENMMISAMSVVGKVRYTWAGGHQGASTIRGINPIWQSWEELYPSSAVDESTGKVNAGYGSCIKPSGSWCPIHGYNEDDRCIEYDTFTSFSEYLRFRIEEIGENLVIDKYKNMITLDPEGVSAHRLDGLDCSGFASWVFNQITNKYNIDSAAMYFTRQDGIESLDIGSELLPGDMFAWTSHIVMIVGKASDKSKAYVTVEQTPNVLKFGVVYYSGARTADIEHAMYVAREANKLLGNVTEEPHSYCMNNVGYYDIELSDNTEVLGDIKSIEEVTIPVESDTSNDSGDSENIEDSTEGEPQGETPQEETPQDETPQGETIRKAKVQYVDIGRFKDKFIDEGVVIDKYSKPIEDMLGEEVIAYTLTKMPISYITGYSEYNGALFDKSTIATDVGTTIIKE